MKKVFFLTVCLLVGYVASAQNLQAYLSYAAFLSPKDGPYVETYITFNGSSVKYASTSNGTSAQIEVIMLFKQNDTIKQYKKYIVNSPVSKDSVHPNFLDLQRFTLPNGKYNFEIQLTDLNNPDKKPFKGGQEIMIDFFNNELSISGIQLIGNWKKTTTSNEFSKSGLDLIPYNGDYYPANIEKISYYAEVYNVASILGRDSAFVINQYIESFETGRKVASLIKSKREIAKDVNIIFNEFDLKKLPSGNYNLIVEVRDRSNTLKAYNSTFFQRNNPSVTFEIKDIDAINIEGTFASQLKSADTLKDYIRSLSPISSDLEKEFAQNMIKKGDVQIMQQYFYNFWTQRNAMNPDKAWAEYLEQVKIVNKQFGTKIKKGYDTDRGRVYLQYGEPNTIVDKQFEASVGLSDEGWGNVPYQIWHYYKLKNQGNKKFVFTNPHLALNDYELIHSDARGEIYDPNWANTLSRSQDIMQNNGLTKPSGRAGDLYNNPR